MVEVEEATVVDLLTPRLRDKQVWKDLAEAFDEVLIANVDDPIRQLEFLRFLPPEADSKTLVDVCRMLGFDLSQDVLNLSIDKFTQLASQLGMYPDTNGTEEFTKFISLMTNGNCTVDYLWTQDYVNFYQEPNGPTLDQGGNWFKTTHVNLNMGFSTLDGLQLKAGQTLGQKIRDLFYQQAPASLVIERQTFTVSMECEDFGFAVDTAHIERIYEVQCSG